MYQQYQVTQFHRNVSYTLATDITLAHILTNTCNVQKYDFHKTYSSCCLKLSMKYDDGNPHKLK